MTERHSPCAEQTFALGAFADGELDAMSSIALEEHLRECTGCRAELDCIESLRGLLMATGLRTKAPENLRRQVELASSKTANRPASRPLLPRAVPWLGGGTLGAIAASLLLFLTVPQVTQPGLADALVDNQVRSLQNGHLTDVLTSDRHTVKPWFNGRITYAPPVVDLKDQGFPLVGGRMDVIARENVAVLVYRRRLHTINLFIRPAPALTPAFAGGTHEAGYNLRRWAADGLEYWAVSDLEGSEMDRFHKAFADATKR